MKKLTFLLAVTAFLTGSGLFAAPDKPLVAFESVSNKSDNKSARMDSFPAAVMDRIVNSRRFDVCRTIGDLKSLQAQRIKNQTDQGAYLIRMTVLQYSSLSKKVVRGNRMVIHSEAKIVAQLEFSDARTGKILESKRAQAIKYQDDYTSGDYATVSHTFRLKVMEEAIQAIASECADRFIEMVFPIKLIRISGNTLYINAGQDRVSPGENLNVYKLGEVLIDPDTGESLGDDEEYTAQVRVTQAKQKYSIVTVVNGSVTGNKSQYILRKCSTEQIDTPKESTPEESAPAAANPHGANPF